jgi:hypothetical protein
MRILRLRRGFQADHSSSSYLFYAADQPVGPEGQAIAHRFSSRAEVGKRTARYVKWGESELSYSAYKALLEKHYDVMVSESYSWWSLLIAVPKTAEMQRLLAPFYDARGCDDLGLSVEDACSHACQPEFRLGNLLKDRLDDLWSSGPGRLARDRYRAACHGVTCPCSRVLPGQ